MVKRSLALLLTASAAAAFGAPSAAQAHSASCLFRATVGLVPSGMLVGGAGSYHLETEPLGSAQCEMDGSGVQPSSISSTGQFAQTFCGTGTWWSGYDNPVGGPDSTTLDVGGGIAEVTSAEYAIDFRATQGTLKIHKVNGSVEAGGDDIDGSVAVIPPTGICGSEFEVVGALHAEW